MDIVLTLFVHAVFYSALVVGFRGVFERFAKALSGEAFGLSYSLHGLLL